MPWSKAGSIAPVRAVFFGSMAPEMPESGTEKGVEPRELSLTESGDSHVPLLSADPEKAKEEDTEDEKSRELRLKPLLCVYIFSGSMHCNVHLCQRSAYGKHSG